MNPLDAARASGLIRPGQPLLVLLSGGADSVALLDVAVELEPLVSALHLNYGLREEAAGDERFCRELCDRLGVRLVVKTVAVPGDENVQAWAREARYAAAEALANGDYATGHTLSDQAETVVYRLAVSQGRRALLGMSARRGRLVRPLLAVTREETREWCRQRGLDWREDASNADLHYARARVRERVIPELRELNPAAERNITETAARLREEQEVLDAVVKAAVGRLGATPLVADLRREPPGLARLVLSRLADAPLSRERVEQILSLDPHGTRELDVPGGGRVIAEYGRLRFAWTGTGDPPPPMPLPVPGSVRFGDWEVTALPGDRGEAVLAEAQLREASVRSWREGDRMRPAGLGGTKTLQDLFTDRKVPRALRRTLPVVEAAGAIVWVAGVAAAEREPGEPVSLSARQRGT